MTQSQSQLNATQAELTQLKFYLQHTHGIEEVMNSYRSRIQSR
ncbi:hypothetical protein N0Y54_29605 [Nostoc punctiforme UO1]